MAPPMRYNRAERLYEAYPIEPLIQGALRPTRIANLTGAGKLMIAVLEESYRDLERTSPWQKNYFGRHPARSAYAWFMAEDWGWPFSVVRVAEVLDLDVEKLRKIASMLYHKNFPPLPDGSIQRESPKRGYSPKPSTERLLPRRHLR